MSYQNKCVVCENIFEAQVPHKITCSKECRNIHSKKYHLELYYKGKEPFDGKCLKCEKEIENKAKSARFCSKQCKRKEQRRHSKVYFKTCEYCQKDFETKQKKTIFCSQGCVNSATRKHENVINICLECNKEFEISFIKRNRKFCSRSCATIHQNKAMFYKGSPVIEKMSLTKAKLMVAGKTHPKIQGSLETLKGGKVFYKSSWEKAFVEKIEVDNNIISFKYEPFYLEYKTTEIHHYIPDILLNFNDGTKKLIEIKPSVFLETKINKIKFKTARKYCLKNNMTFEIWTEKNNPYNIILNIH